MLMAQDIVCVCVFMHHMQFFLYLPELGPTLNIVVCVCVCVGGGDCLLGRWGGVEETEGEREKMYGRKGPEGKTHVINFRSLLGYRLLFFVCVYMC